MTDDEQYYETAINLPDGSIVNPKEVLSLPRWAQIAAGLIDPDRAWMPGGERLWTEVRRQVTVSYGDWEPFDREAEWNAWAKEHITTSRYTVDDLRGES